MPPSAAIFVEVYSLAVASPALKVSATHVSEGVAGVSATTYLP